MEAGEALSALAVERDLNDALKIEDYDRATEVLIRGYGASIFRYLMRVSADEGLAHAAFALFCEDVWRGLPQFEGRSSGRTWCFTLARHALSREGRRAHRRREVRWPSEHLRSLAIEIRSTTALHLQSEKKDHLAQLRAALPADDRALLALRVEEGLAWKSIAQILSPDPLSKEALKQRATALRTRFYRLKKELKAQMGDPPAP